ncbi:hypothetical protein ACFW04_013767 [Cataglyphis niger]
MTGCCVSGCKNNNKNRFSLRFSSNGRMEDIMDICEKIDGKSKLKYNSVPTIFPTVKKKEIKKTLIFSYSFIPSIPSVIIKRTTSTSKSVNKSTDQADSNVNESMLESLKKVNKKLQIADVVVYKAEKTKRNLLQQIRKLKDQKRRIEKKFVNIFRNTTKNF